ncbi:RluA family pseudouridine synthase [Candidatus Xianfuyuplasma coldseepsis]|uniref:Pseudouridine synthase n=1 Tax=Candidatus Xianfuyuplasma coldseepsis TaxID=2782163 RepID=A0A7L7KUF5_9MOLU|nr:RluA family pseudouridine synthase [Xianfuyuplasma coldseepsis]QMS85876.1 RluA family pseudouridine synthase [Xianfuyuplasma coldseepsis]
METIIVKADQRLDRIDKYLADLLQDSRSTIQVMIKEEYILVNDEVVKTNYKVKEGDVITIEPMEEEEIDVTPENLPLEIVYQDDDVIVVNKSDDMVVHPGAGNYSGTMVNALLYHIPDFKAIKGEIRPGIVHRIDKETSGLLMVAKTPKALEHLSKQLQEKTVTRTYVALVDGVIPHNLGRIDAPIGRDPKNRQKMAVVEHGKPAVTNFNVVQRFAAHTLIECHLETGRTHQIRVHMNYINFPIVGDPKYGLRKTDTTHGQFLHAKTLGFIHPVTNEYMEFTSELPEYFTAFLEELE